MFAADREPDRAHLVLSRRSRSGSTSARGPPVSSSRNRRPYHAERAGRPPEAVDHELVDLVGGGDALVDDLLGLGDHREVDAVRDESPRHRGVAHDDRVLAAPGRDLADRDRSSPRRSRVSSRSRRASSPARATPSASRSPGRAGRSPRRAPGSGSPTCSTPGSWPSGATRSRSRNTRIFRSSRSGTASITRSVLAASSNASVKVSRSSAASASSRVSLPRVDTRVEAVPTGRHVLACGRRAPPGARS